jgi:anti-sigma B factor antagonist
VTESKVLREKKRSGDEPQNFVARRRSTGDEAVVEFGGECDASSLEELNAVLAEAFTEPPGRVVVDLTRVTFVDSVTLGALVAAAKRVRVSGGSFQVVGAVACEVRRAFELTGLTDYLLVQSRD